MFIGIFTHITHLGATYSVLSMSLSVHKTTVSRFVFCSYASGYDLCDVTPTITCDIPAPSVKDGPTKDPDSVRNDERPG